MANPWNGVRVNQPYTSLGPLGLLFQCARGGRDVPTPYPSAEFVIISHCAVFFVPREPCLGRCESIVYSCFPSSLLANEGKKVLLVSPNTLQVVLKLMVL